MINISIDDFDVSRIVIEFDCDSGKMLSCSNNDSERAKQILIDALEGLKDI